MNDSTVVATASVAIDAALAAWKQGDCVVGEQWFLFRQSDGEDGIQERSVDGLVVVTQTCDAVRNSAARPFVEVSPLVKVPEKELHGIQRGRMLRYAFVPGVADRCLVADVDRTMTVDKQVVARWARVEGCRTDAESRSLAETLARKRQRFAFPDAFTAFVRPLQQRFKEKHEKQSPEGEAMRALREIRVLASPSWSASADPIDLEFFLVCDAVTKEAIGVQQGVWSKLLTASAPFRAVAFKTVSLEELTAAQYVATDPLDLEYLSWPGP